MSNTADAPAIAPCAIVGDAGLYQADCRDVLRSLADNSIDSIVTDPPYALVSIVKRFGKPGSAPAKGNEAYQRASAGFMGKSWDTGEVAFSEEFWRECLRVLKPGGHIVAFSGTRTYHRMAVAIEDAGFEIRDQLGWLYGSGFPKSHNQHDEWEGWGTALKPAWEPIALARKPLDGTVAANLAKWGVGALNIDGCRVKTDDKLGGGNTSASVDRSGKHDGWKRPWMEDTAAVRAAAERSAASVARSEELGRWPANIVHDGSDEVIAAFPNTKSGKPSGLKAGNNNNIYGQFAGGVPVTGFGDEGSAARFFYCAKASRKDRDKGLEQFDDEIVDVHARHHSRRMQAVKRSDGAPPALGKNTHPTVKPTDLMRWLCRLITPPGGVILDPFMGSGSTGKAALLEGFRFIGVEREDEYMPIAQARIAATLRPVAAKAQPANDNHPPVQASLFGDAA
ncbi:DNA-methyltransferase [Brucella intermedia]|uniref:DNA-methyltransferase n=1 Tax=Brucella intermedia TaxID=94625 RepID=UPI00165D0ACA|nr:site-specific DNA-methyltransferase [Brucella intermedia]QNQ43031.1 site-specific DNA-methyltransferase [Brucella intermedia]